MSKIYLQFKLPVTILREKKRYVAYSPIIDLATSGKTKKEVQKRFIKASEIFFEEIIKKGTVNTVLSDLGWYKTKEKWTPPLVVSHRSEEVCVPA